MSPSSLGKSDTNKHTHTYNIFYTEISHLNKIDLGKHTHKQTVEFVIGSFYTQIFSVCNFTPN